MTAVIEKRDFSKPIVRRKVLSASNDGSMATRVKLEGFSEFTYDEPSQHGGTDLGPTPLTGVLSALKGALFGRSDDAREKTSTTAGAA